MDGRDSRIIDRDRAVALSQLPSDAGGLQPVPRASRADANTVAWVRGLANQSVPGVSQRAREILEEAEARGMLYEAISNPWVELATICDALSFGEVEIPVALLTDFLTSTAERAKKYVTALRASRHQLESQALHEAHGATEEDVKSCKLRVDTMLKVAEARKRDEPEGDTLVAVPFIAVMESAPTALGAIIDQHPDDADEIVEVMPDLATRMPRPAEATNETIVASDDFLAAELEVTDDTEVIEPTHARPVVASRPERSRNRAKHQGSQHAPQAGPETFDRIAPPALQSVVDERMNPPVIDDEHGTALVDTRPERDTSHIPEPDLTRPAGLPDLPPVLMNPSDYAKTPGEDRRSVQWDVAPIETSEQQMTRDKAARKLGFRR